MSLTASMWTGVSGLLAHGEKMNVVGNNIANVSTVGFKGQRMDFADFVYQNSFSNAGVTQIGRGVKIGAVMGNFTGGPMETTTEATDMAITGRGFFKVNKVGSDQAYYTRAGNFRFNYEGYLMDPNGLALQGWKVDNNGGVTQAAGGMTSPSTEKKSDIIGSGVPMDVKLDTWTVAPQQTTKITFKSQLPNKGSDNARDNTNPFAALFQTWNGTQPPATESTPPIAESSYGYQTTMDVYDEAGTKHKITIYYDRVNPEDYEGGDNSNDIWEYMVTMDPAEDQRMFWDDATGSLRKVNETKAGGILMSGTMTFNSGGQIVNQSAYTWGGDQNPTDDPASFANVPDPADPLKTLKVVNLDPSDMNNWRPAAISSNGYPLVVANFSGLLDAQTPGSPNGQKYNIEMDFGLKVGNFSTPWENQNSLGSLAVDSYSRNPNYISGGSTTEGAKFIRMNPNYDPQADPLTDPNAYKYLFDVPGYSNDPYPADAATDTDFQKAFRQTLLKYKGVDSITLKAGEVSNTAGNMQPPVDILVQLGPNGEIKTGQKISTAITIRRGEMDSTATPPVPPVDITAVVDTSTNPHTIKDGQAYTYTDATGAQQTFNLNDAIRDYNNGGGNADTDFITPPHYFDVDQFVTANGGPTAFQNTYIDPKVEEAIKKNAVADSSMLTSATPANANNLSNINKPVIIDSTATTNYGTTFTASQSQDGYGYGDLTSWSVDAQGVLYGVYSNGVTLPLWQVCLYDFNCCQGLRREGNNLFSQTRDSGEAKSGPAGVAGLGTINGQSLEQSNVDMSTEFVQMISTQRGFQSNSKIITTTDTMLETVISMKR